MPQWEYKVLTEFLWTETELNKHGKQRWELLPMSSRTLLIFKRPLIEKVGEQVDTKPEGD